MKKEFNYVVERSEDVSSKLQEFDAATKEEFKAPVFKLNRGAFLNVAKCFEDPKKPMQGVEECTMKAFEPLANYERELQTIWKTELTSMRGCFEKCQPTDKTCLSKCFNDFAARTHSKLTDIHNHLV